ncbi:MAG: TlpA family protein disulfide reductase [Variibacter sp.]|nr:TlpA family protein disulfide reductase [Variibacter sp.]
MTSSRDKVPPRAPRVRAPLLLTAAFVTAAGLAAVYGIAGFGGKSGAAECTVTRALAQRLAPLARGEVAAVTLAGDPRPLPELAFGDAEGARRSLAEWRGRVVLLNLWATWCVPCRKEMPALDALEAKLGGPDFQVVAVNIDTRDADKPKAWLEAAGIRRLAYFADPSAKIFQDLKAAGKAFGMPTTVLVDRNGCEIGSLAGPAEWASEDAIRLVSAALQR